MVVDGGVILLAEFRLFKQVFQLCCFLMILFNRIRLQVFSFIHYRQLNNCSLVIFFSVIAATK